MNLDIVIRNGTVVDGTGNPAFAADVGIHDGRIVMLGDLSNQTAQQEIDATHRVIAPGFVDAHAHSDYLILADPSNENKVLQGVTLDVAGNCGYSAAPLGNVYFKEWWAPDISERFSVCSREEGQEFLDNHGIELNWHTLDGYLTEVEKKMPATNYLNFVGQVALRLAAYGDFSRRPTPEEFETIKHLLSESMQAGAFGVSTESGSHKDMDFDTEELIELCKVAAQYGGIFSNHMRNYDKDVVSSTEEALSIAEAANIPLIISHINVQGRDEGVPAEAFLGLLDASRDRGLQVTADIMPYGYREALFFSARVSDMLPEWAVEGGAEGFSQRMESPEIRERLKAELRDGKSSSFYVSPNAKPGEAYDRGPLSYPGWENQLEIVASRDSSVVGRNVGELAREQAVDAYDALFQVLAGDFDAAKVFRGSCTEEDLKAMVTHPWVAFGGDGAQTRAIQRPGIPNPTQYGVFPMILGRYVRQKGWMRLEDAIRKMTSLPCTAMGIYDRGVVRPGFRADITIFDPDRVIDCPNYYEYPSPYVTGINDVIVNGVHTVADGVLNGDRGGHVLRKESRHGLPVSSNGSRG